MAQSVLIIHFLKNFLLQGVPKNAPMFQPLPTTWGRFLGHGVYVYLIAGLLLGSNISKKFAAFLEENELFVPDDDDVD